jgi:signal transduction histidine kinase
MASAIRSSIPMRFRRRLRSRIILAFLVFGTGLTVTFAGITLVMREWLEDELIETTLQREVDNFVDFKRVNPDPNAPFVFSTDITARVFGRARFANVPFEWRGFDSGVHEIQEAGDDGPRTYKLAVRKDDDFWGFLRYDVTEQRRTRNLLVGGLVFVVLGFAALSLVIAVWLSSRVLRPVTDLVARVRAFERGKQPPPLAPHFAGDEVGELAAALDDYSHRLNELVVRDREFNADVSHELRTPLAVIRGATELLLAQEGMPDKTRERVRRIDRAVRHSTELTQALLLLSRSERAAPTDGETSDVAQVVEQVIDTHRPQLGNKPVEVVVERIAPAQVAAPSSVLAVALGNLIGNAFKYTPAGRIEVRIEAHRVVIADSGPGIGADQAVRLFERGVRGEGAPGGGAGLGLAIVRRLCELYGWQVSLAPREGGGAVAVLEFGA